MTSNAPSLLDYNILYPAKPPLPQWMPEGADVEDIWDHTLPLVPPPPIPEELRAHPRIIYGFELTTALINSYIERHGITGVPPDEDSRNRYMYALVRVTANRLKMGFITSYYQWPRYTRAPRDGMQDLVYWSAACYGQLQITEIPTQELIQQYLDALDFGMVPCWQPCKWYRYRA